MTQEPETPAGTPTARPDAPVLLVGMSPSEAADASRLDALAAPHGAAVAHLQLGEPSLRHALDDLADAGAERVVVVGVQLGRTAPGVSWLRRLAAHWWRERTAPRPVVEVGISLVRDAATLRAVVGGLLKPVDGSEPGLTSAAWEDVPGHRHQVLVCRGPRCTARGAEDTAVALTLELMRLGQGDDDVLVTQTGCLFPCNHAPVVAVQPDDVWYSRVDADAVRQIATDHLLGHRPVADRQLSRSRKDVR